MGLTRKVAQILCVGLALVVCASAVVQGPQASGTLRGQVTDEQGGVITGATVTLIDSNNTEKTATTNDQGVFTFNNIPPGGAGNPQT